MKLLVVFCVVGVAVVGVAVARPQQADERNAETIEMNTELRGDQSYDFSYSTSNNIEREESGLSYPGDEPESGNYVQSGSYEFTHPDGTVSYVSFIADENGYQPESDAIPVFTGRVDIQDA